MSLFGWVALESQVWCTGTRIAGDWDIIQITDTKHLSIRPLVGSNLALTHYSAKSIINALLFGNDGVKFGSILPRRCGENFLSRELLGLRCSQANDSLLEFFIGRLIL